MLDEQGETTTAMRRDSRPLILGLGGTTKRGSLTEKALHAALQLSEDAGADTVAVSGPDLIMPMYDPAVRELTPNAAQLLQELRRCNGIILSSPSYHGTVSGLLKNALDYVEEMRDDDPPYLSGRAVGCIVCAGGPQGYGTTLLAMRSIVNALRAWSTPMGVGLGGEGAPLFDGDGRCLESSTSEQMQVLARQVVNYGRVRHHLLGDTRHTTIHSYLANND